jgi:hypothetical protein
LPRRNDIAKILVIACVVLSAHVARAAKPVEVKRVFCVPRPEGWHLQRFKPLIDPRGKTVFAEMSLAGSLLLEVRLRRFAEKTETTFDYKFDESGQLNSLMGSVRVFGAWDAEANLYPDADGTVPPYHVKYLRNNEPVSKPEDAVDYVGLLDAVPIYRTVQAVPCASMLKEAEKMNATQE